MSLDHIKNSLFLSLDELFATAAVNNMAGDSEAYRENLKTIGKIAEILGIETEITTVTIDLKSEDSQMDTDTYSNLTWEAQSLLRIMSDIYIDKGLSSFFFPRSERAELLVKNGYCIERFENYTTYADYHSRDMIIEALRNAKIYEVYPAKNTQKRELNAIVEDLEKNRQDDLKQGIILLDFYEDPKIAMHEFRGSRNTQEDKQRRLDFLLEKGINPKELCKPILKK